MRLKIFSLVGLLMLLAACAPTYSIRTSSDPVLGIEVNRMQGNYLQSECLLCGHFQLNASQHVSASGVSSYALLVDYLGNRWFFIESGQSLSLRIDGDLVRLNSPSGSSGSRRVIYGSDVAETATYPTDIQLLRRLAAAETVIIRLDGGNGYINLSFGPENFVGLQRFIAEYVD